MYNLFYQPYHQNNIIFSMKNNIILIIFKLKIYSTFQNAAK